MSYILEALRKSEQDRQRAAAPGLATLHVDTLPEPGHPAAMGALPLLAGATLVMCALVLIWSHPWRSTHSGTPGDATALPMTPPETRPRLAALHPPAAMPLPKAAHAMREGKIAAPHPPIKRSRPGPPPQATVAAAAEKPVATRAAIEPQAKPPAGSPEIVAFSELPSAVQQALPKLSVSGFVQYPGDSPGDADKRMIGIGEHLAQQGDEISPGLKVEQIASDRVVFAYKGYRFWLGVH